MALRKSDSDIWKQRDRDLDALADTLFGPLAPYAAGLIRIATKEGGLQYLHLNEPQRHLDRAIERQRSETGRVRMLVPKARQLGVSTYTAIRFYRRTTSLEGQTSFILTHEDKATQNLFQIPKTAHDNMLPELKLTASSDAANQLQFRAARSQYILATARTRGTGRSFTLHNFHGSEAAYWPNAETHLSAALEAVGANGTEVILESTGNGPAGPFYDLCMQAVAGKGDFELCFLPWFQMEGYRRRPPEGWKVPPRWLEYGRLHALSKNQVNWAYQKNLTLSLESRVDPDAGPCHSFKREYPATLEEVFTAQGKPGTVSAEAVLKARKCAPFDDRHAPLILGVDVARHGDDLTWLIDRKGRDAGIHINQKINTPDLMQVVGMIARYIQQHRPAKVFIDVTGMGWGVYDRLVELRYSNVVVAVNFGETALEEERFANRRSEIWITMAEWFDGPAGASIPDQDHLAAHITPVRHGYDSRGRYRLIRKEETKKEFGFSPDGGDALALTFAEPVASLSGEELEDVMPGRLPAALRDGGSGWAL